MFPRHLSHGPAGDLQKDGSKLSHGYTREIVNCLINQVEINYFMIYKYITGRLKNKSIPDDCTRGMRAALLHFFIDVLRASMML